MEIKSLQIPLIILFFLLTDLSAGYGQCRCDNDSLLAETLNCDTTRLSNNSRLYYQGDCDSIWLTLEAPKGQKHTIFSMGAELAAYNFRLGFQLIKEFDNALLFRYLCAANGPCAYQLIDKNSGQTQKKFKELVYTSEGKKSDIVIYFTDTSLAQLTIYNVDNKVEYQLAVPSEV